MHPFAQKKDRPPWRCYVPTAIGWFLIFAGAIFVGVVGRGFWAFVVLACAFLMIGTLVRTVLASLPENVALEPLPYDVAPPTMMTLVHHLERLGFRPFGGPVRVELKPPAVLIPLIHHEHRSFATVFETGTTPRKIAFDIVSLLDEEGSLTSNAELLGGALPLPETTLRQVFPGADPTFALRRHLDGLTHLSKCGLEPRVIEEEDFRPMFVESIRRQRSHFLEAPVWKTLVLLWRSVTRSTPYRGPIESQPIARRGIEKLLRTLRRTR